MFERAVAFCRGYEILNIYRSVAAKLGTAYVRCGRAEEAIAILEPVTDLNDYLKGGTYIWLWLFLGLGEAYLATDRIEDALVYVNKGLDLTGATNEHPHHAYALRLLGHVQAKQGAKFRLKAERSYREAIARAESCDMRPMVAHCHSALGKLYLGANRKADALRELEFAAQAYEDLDLPIFSQIVKTSLGQLAQSPA